MGPNESWQSEVEQQLRSLKDYSINQSINQLAAQGQSNYELPVRNNPQEDPTTTSETIWIRMTEKGTANGQIFYSWRRQIKVATANGYEWLDNGDSGTLDYYPATGLNNDDVPTTDMKRYPAKWNAGTSQWVFFSNTTNRQGIFKWCYGYSVYASFTSLPTLNASASANISKDTASFNTALKYLWLDHKTGPGNRRHFYAPGLGVYWSMLSQASSIGSDSFYGNTDAYPIDSNVTGIQNRFSIGYFPQGTPKTNNGEAEAGIPEGVVPGTFLPNVGERFNGVGEIAINYDGSIINYFYNASQANDESSPAFPTVKTYFDGFENKYTSYQYLTMKTVTFKRYQANGTSNSTGSISMIRVVPANATANASNQWYYGFGPDYYNPGQGYYRFPGLLSCVPSNVAVGGNGNITIRWSQE